MFTGIITDLGTLRAARGDGMRRLEITTIYPMNDVPIGASIACNGVCLTVVEKGTDWFGVDVSPETLARTTIGDWTVGQRINLERALKLGDELGGHMVSGHVDDVATVVSVTPEHDNLRFIFNVPVQLAHFVAPKGSVALDGVSLTVNEVVGRQFGVNVIPLTQRLTGFGFLKPGDRVNMEIDLVARYLVRWHETEKQ